MKRQLSSSFPRWLSCCIMLHHDDLPVISASGLQNGNIPGQRLPHSPDLLIDHLLPLRSSLLWQSSVLASMLSGQRSMPTSALS